MRRPLGYLLAWLAATALAVGGSWVGLQPLLDAAAAERPPSLSASQLRQAAPPGPDPSPAPSPTATAPPSSSPAPAEATAPPPAAPMPTGGTEWREVPDSRALERTFVVTGGEVVFQASRQAVEVISHTATPGFEVSVNRWARNSVMVSFESPQHNSRVWVMWRNGPYAEIIESA